MHHQNLSGNNFFKCKIYFIISGAIDNREQRSSENSQVISPFEARTQNLNQYQVYPIFPN